MSSSCSGDGGSPPTIRNHFRHKSVSKAPALFHMKSSGPQIFLTTLGLRVGYDINASSQVPSLEGREDNVPPHTQTVSDVARAYSLADPKSTTESEGEDHVKPGDVTD